MFGTPLDLRAYANDMIAWTHYNRMERQKLGQRRRMTRLMRYDAHDMHSGRYRQDETLFIMAVRKTELV